MRKLEETLGELLMVAIDRSVAVAIDKARLGEAIPVRNEDDEEASTSEDAPLTASEPEQASHSSPSCGHYYLDEAGDATIFGHKGRVIIGDEGCSRFALLGLLAVEEPERLAREIDELRASLVADPYFAGVPSFDPARRKTALFFHAKDDLPEVRREVFHLLLRHEVKFSVVISDKRAVLEQHIRRREREDPDYRYNPNDQYDYQVRCLFKGRLHKKEVLNIHFADRGKSDRTHALRAALEAQQQELNAQWNIRGASTLNVSVHSPWERAGLQAVDYFLWAVQRLCEREEDRFLNLLQPKISLINDRNDMRGGRGGMFYSRKKPLTLAAFRLRDTEGSPSETPQNMSDLENKNNTGSREEPKE